MNLKRSIFSKWAGLLLAIAGWPALLPAQVLPPDFVPKAMRHVEALVDFSPRQAGTPNESRAARYIAGQFKGMGLQTTIESFAFESFEPSRIKVKIGGESFNPVGLGMDPYAGALSYSGAFVLLDARNPSAWPASAAVEGKVAITAKTDDQTLHFRMAALQPRFIVILTPDDFTRAQGCREGELSLSITGRLKEGRSQNVIAHLGSNLPGRQIIIGAHLDAYREAPGASDNASGIAALLELASHFKKEKIPAGAGIDFIAFGAEELGVLGSRRYVERHAKELSDCSLVLILDNLGGDRPVQVERLGGRSTPPANLGAGIIPQVYRNRAWEGLHYPWKLLPPPAFFAVFGASYHPSWLVECIDDAVKGLGFPVQFTALQGSDQLAFAQAGIATSGISAVSDRQHSPQDLPANVKGEKVRQCAETAARIVMKVLDRTRASSERIQPSATPAPEDNLTQAGLAAHVRFLAAEELRGRMAGTPEADIAARYVAERFRAAGVKTLPGAPDYFQDVVWPRKNKSSASALDSTGSEAHSRNVVGFVQGRDPRLARQFILVAAHYDGQGVRIASGTETVLPGARDNAMGTAALLAAAEALAARPPERSVLLLATTAEEEGMIGSRFFADHPLVPLAQIVFVLNNDGAGVYDPALWCIGGLERTTATALAASVGDKYGLATRPYPEMYRFLYAEGDSISFARKGIPSLTVSPGFQVGDGRLRKYNHTPADRVDAEFDERYLLKFSRAFVSLARAMADAGTLPAWQPGDPFAPRSEPAPK